MGVRGLVWLLMSAPAALPFRPAHAADTVYEYHIEHPRYGDIGTYRNTIRETGADAQVDTDMHVAVKVLGIVVFREDAKRTENWQGDRLMRFASVTDTNGTKIEVHGEAHDDSFIVTTPTGTITAPAQVHPSNPWTTKVFDTDVMMSTKSGRVEKVSVTGGRIEPVTFDGIDFRLKRYDIVGTKRQSVWLDDRGVPVAFRTEEDGASVDFVLNRPRAGDPTGGSQVRAQN